MFFCFAVHVLISYELGGRPDVMKLITEVYATWGAEVVFITSNWGGNKEMMEGCKAAGIPAFVSLFDHHLVSVSFGTVSNTRSRARYGTSSPLIWPENRKE